MLSLSVSETDKESEVLGLSLEKYTLRKQLDDQLGKICKEKEIIWFQRAREKMFRR